MYKQSVYDKCGIQITGLFKLKKVFRIYKTGH